MTQHIRAKNENTSQADKLPAPTSIHSYSLLTSVVDLKRPLLTDTNRSKATDHKGKP